MKKLALLLVLLMCLTVALAENNSIGSVGGQSPSSGGNNLGSLSGMPQSDSGDFSGAGAVPAGASSEVRVHNPDGVFSDSEVAALEEWIGKLNEEFGIDLLVSITDSVTSEAYDYLPTIQTRLRGDCFIPESGVFVICLANRTYWFEAYGDLDRALTAYNADKIDQRVQSHLRSNDYIGAVRAWLSSVEEACTPRSAFAKAADYLVFIVIIAALIALIVVLIMKKQLLTAKFQTSAREYVRENSLHLTRQADHYLYQTVTVRVIPKSTGGGGRSGGGGGRGGSSSGRGGSF